MNDPSVLPFLCEPEREDTLRAVSLALLKIRASGATCKEIARKIGCHFDTVEAASNERSLLALDTAARLAFHYPETRPYLAGLWELGTPADPTAVELIARGQALIARGIELMGRSERAAA